MGQTTTKDKQNAEEAPPRSKSADTLTSEPSSGAIGDGIVPTIIVEETKTVDPAAVNTDNRTSSESANGDMRTGSGVVGDVKTGSGVVEGSGASKDGVDKKESKLSAFSRIFKPWKWRRRKKTSEKIKKTAVDLERKISVRSPREDLIKRGVLKEVDENGEPIIPEEPPIPEENDEDMTSTEAAKDDSSDSEYKQANGSAAATPQLPQHAMGGDYTTNSIKGTCDADTVGPTPPPKDNTISLSPEYYTRPANAPASQYGAQHGNYAGDEVHTTESTTVEPKQIRVMLPVSNKDRQVPVLHKISVQHEPPDYTPSPPPDHHHSPLIVSSSYNHSPLLNNNVYTPTSMYPTPTLKTQTLPINRHESPYLPTSPTEVPISEPDLDKKPLRSAMKGGKSKALLQQQLQAKLQQRQFNLGSETSAGYNGSLSRTGPKVAPKPKMSVINSLPVRISDHNKENSPDYDNLHSDSDEEVQYDDRDRESILAAKVQRQDSLERFLSQRPDRAILIERNILPNRTDTERQRERDLIGNRLTRRLSLRPTIEELENRNILHSLTHDQYIRDKEEKKKTLIRKLSFRPSVDELKGRKIILFSDYVEVTDANEYDRRADKPWTRLTPKDKAAIRKELNDFKSSEMDVHDDSRHLTRFHRP